MKIARKAKERDTGARGLRSIVEEIMTDIMFELPDIEAKGKYCVTEAVVSGEIPLFGCTPATDKKSLKNRQGDRETGRRDTRK